MYQTVDRNKEFKIQNEFKQSGLSLGHDSMADLSTYAIFSNIERIENRLMWVSNWEVNFEMGSNWWVIFLIQ